MRVCDGCGAPADEAHIHERIERLELATRFRPIHIQVLVVGDAPPARAEDYFYRPRHEGAPRSAEAAEYFLEMLTAAGITREAGGNEVGALAEFQHRGFYLADVLECPVPAADESTARITQAAPTIEKRIQFSYRPKLVVLIGTAARELAAILKKSAFADRLVSVDADRKNSGGPSGKSAVSGAEIAAALARLSPESSR